MDVVGGGVVVSRPEENVRGRCGGVPDEEVAGPVELEGRSVDEHLVHVHVVRLAGRAAGHQHGRHLHGPGREEGGPVDGLEVAAGNQVVAQEHRRQAPGVGRRRRCGRLRTAGAVRRRAEEVAVAGGVAPGRELGCGVARPAEVEHVCEGPRHRARDADRVAAVEGGGVVAGVEGEAGVRAAVRRPRPAAGALLDGVAGVGIVQPHHDPTRRVAGDPVQPEIAVGVVDEGHHTAEGLDALLDEHVTGDDVAGRRAVGGDGGETPGAREIAAVELRQAGLAVGHAGVGSLGQELLEGQAVGGQVDEQVPWQDDRLAGEEDAPAGPHVGRVVDPDGLDLTRHVRHGAGGRCGLRLRDDEQAREQHHNESDAHGPGGPQAVSVRRAPRSQGAGLGMSAHSKTSFSASGPDNDDDAPPTFERPFTVS